MKYKFIEEELEVDSLIETEDNPNEMTAKELEALTVSVDTFGPIRRMVCRISPDDKSKRIIINGHQYKDILKRLIIKKVGAFTFPADITKEDVIKIRQAMNKIHGTHKKVKDLEDINELLKKDSIEDIAPFFKTDDKGMMDLIISLEKDTNKVIEGLGKDKVSFEAGTILKCPSCGHEGKKGEFKKEEKESAGTE